MQPLLSQGSWQLPQAQQRQEPPWMPLALPAQCADKNAHLGHTDEDLLQHWQPAAQLQRRDWLGDHQWLNYVSQGQSKDEYEWRILDGKI